MELTYWNGSIVVAAARCSAALCLLLGRRRRPPRLTDIKTEANACDL